jgi:hypothetical protein
MGYMSTIWCAVYYTSAAKYRAHQPVCVLSTMGPVKYIVIAVLHIPVSTSISTYLRCHYWYVDNSMHVVFYNCCQIQRTSSCWCRVNSRRCQILRNCSSTDSVLNIQSKVSPFLLHICLQFDAHSIPHLLPNKAQTCLFALYQLWALTNPVYLQFCRYCHKYSIERISDPIGDMWRIRSALYPKFAAKFVRAMSTLETVKYIAIAVMHSPASTSIWTYLRCYWW